MKTRIKVFCYVTHGSRLLVFIERASAEFGLQVPAGTPKNNEALTDAAMREAREETGLNSLRLIKQLGSYHANQQQYGLDSIERHFGFPTRATIIQNDI